MSRFHGEWDGEGPPPEFWHQAVKNALKGRKGQAILRELREALKALPSPRLIKGSIVAEGEVCAIGALAAYRMHSGPLALGGWFEARQVATLEELSATIDCESEFETLELGQSMGLVRALAWAISYENDEGTWKDETPEERYRRVLAWVEREMTTVCT